jgi:hypothetical protein
MIFIPSSLENHMIVCWFSATLVSFDILCPSKPYSCIANILTPLYTELEVRRLLQAKFQISCPVSVAWIIPKSLPKSKAIS